MSVATLQLSEATRANTILLASVSIAEASTLVELERSVDYWLGQLYTLVSWAAICHRHGVDEPIVSMGSKRSEKPVAPDDRRVSIPLPMPVGLHLRGTLDLTLDRSNEANVAVIDEMTQFIRVLANSIGHLCLQLQALAQTVEMRFIQSLLKNKSGHSMGQDLDLIAEMLLKHLEVSSLHILVAGPEPSGVGWGVSSRRELPERTEAERFRLLQLVQSVVHNTGQSPISSFLAYRKLLLKFCQQFDLPHLAQLQSLLIVPIYASDRLLGAILVAEERHWNRQSISPQALTTCRILARSIAEWLADSSLLEAMVEQGRAMQALVDALGEAVVATKNHVIVTWNQAATEMFGYAASEVLGKSMTDILPSVPPELVNYTPNEVQKTRSTPSIEWKLQTVGGRDLHLACSVTPIFDLDQSMPLMMHTFRDIGREQELEYLKEELLSAVSHELRTPLNGIYGFARLLLDRPHMSDAMRRESLESLNASIERLKRMADDFIDVARSRRHRLPLDLDIIDAGHVIRTAVQEARRYHVKHAINLRVHSELPPVRGDSMRIKQIIDNLISNAVKYSPEGTRIFVYARQRNQVVAVSVSDQGIGIPKPVQEHIFDAFYRADNSRSNRATGVGLGLSIVKSLVQAQGGEVTVQSVPGHGSTFTFTIPIVSRVECAPG